MGRRQDERRLRVRRERLRELTQLSADDIGQVVGGNGRGVRPTSEGRLITRTCID
jgi:hypothetical protein